MSELAVFLGEWPIRSALAGGALLLAAAVAMRFIRQPARRQRLGEAALAGSLLAAVLCGLPHWLPFSFSLPILPRGPSQASAPSHPAPAPVADVIDAVELSTFGPAQSTAIFIAPPDRILTAPSVEGTDEEAAVSNDVAALPAEVPDAPVSAEIAPADNGISWWPFLILGGSIYLTVLFWNLLCCLLGYAGLWRWRRSSRQPPGRVREMLAEMTAGWRRSPELRLTRRVPLPISFGLFWPTILIPPQFARRAAAEQLRWILIHELTHLRRRDSWSCLLLALGQAVYFFVPWFWWVRRQVRLCQEYVADAAAAAVASSTEYAQYLVSLSLFARRRPFAASLAASVLGNSSDLYRRIAMLLAAKQKVDGGCPRGWSLAAGTLVLAIAVGLSGIGLRVQAAEVETVEPAPATVAEKPSTESAEAKTAPNRIILQLAETLPHEERTHVRRWLVGPSEPEDGETLPGRRFGVREAWQAAGELRLKFADGKWVSPLPDMCVIRPRLHQDRADELEQLEKSLKKMEEQLKLLQDLKGEQRATVQRALEMAWREPAEARKAAAAALHNSVSGFLLSTADENLVGRLGIVVEPPTAALLNQLNFAAGRGLVARLVVPEGTAAKAGILAHDFLVEFAGKPVPDNVKDFVKLVQAARPNQEIDVIVIRKGEKKTIIGIKLPDDGVGQRRQSTETIGLEWARPVKPASPSWPAGTFAPAWFRPIDESAEAGALTRAMLPNGGFKISREGAGNAITIDGPLEKGKARGSAIAIVAGKKRGADADVGEIPGPHWQKLKELIDLAEKTAGHK